MFTFFTMGVPEKVDDLSVLFFFTYYLFTLGTPVEGG